MQADYVVVGAGSAGCVLANRLSADGAKVVLLEAGPPDRHPMIHIPAGIRTLLQHPVLNWNYETEADASTGGRNIAWPRGKTLGGSSSINGMLYVRGNPADYDGWSQMGCRGWSYDDVLPYFKKSEDYRNGGDPDIRGKGGVLKVEDYRTILPLTHYFVEAAKQAGYPFTPDYNGRQQEGVGYSQMTRDVRFRASTAQTFLKEARSRPNLDVVTGAMATGLLFDGRKCVGVKFRRGNGPEEEVRVTREVVVSGGAINSPHLLQISGIGPADHLQSIGVAVRHDLPGVGRNLSDHFVTRISHRVRHDLMSINQLSRGLRVMGEAVKYALFANGALTFGVTSAMVFCRSREGLSSPDLQLLFTPASYSAAEIKTFDKEPGITVAVCPVRPDSRGTILAKSGDPMERPAIRPNYLSADSDVLVIQSGIRQTRKILSAPAIAEISKGELAPGPEVDSFDTVKDYTHRNGNTIYHPVGTCKMGEDPMAVVDSRLRVRGIAGLRVVDASVMPTVTTGNTNAPTIMIGEKASAMIIDDNRAG
ncbi:MAG: GMC family oxidoreductase N-terminal domain-containing protein [Alphaproteobacteria bacterium]